MDRPGALRVNATDYDEIVIEQFNYWNRDEPSWAVPAWEEWGEGDLAGPFTSADEAKRVLHNH